MDIATLLQEIRSGKPHSKNCIEVGVLSTKIIDYLTKHNVPIHTKEIYLNHKGLSHMQRQEKKRRGAGLDDVDILAIPKILKSPSDVFFDPNKGKLNIYYCQESKSCEKIVKVVVDTKFIYKGKRLTLIKTAGYIAHFNKPKSEELRIL